MILGGGVAVCLLLSAHCAVIFAIAQLSCLLTLLINLRNFNVTAQRLIFDILVRSVSNIIGPV